MVCILRRTIHLHPTNVIIFPSGMLVTATVKRTLFTWKPASDRILSARPRSQCYAPKETSDIEEEDAFYYCAVQERINTGEIVILMVDLRSNKTFLGHAIGNHILTVVWIYVTKAVLPSVSKGTIISRPSTRKEIERHPYSEFNTGQLLYNSGKSLLLPKREVDRWNHEAGSGSIASVDKWKPLELHYRDKVRGVQCSALHNTRYSTIALVREVKVATNNDNFASVDCKTNLQMAVNLFLVLWKMITVSFWSTMISIDCFSK